MPGRSEDEDAPRWEPPAPSTETPRWEPPPPAAGEVPRWEPDREVPRRKPPGGSASGAHLPAEAVARRAPAEPVPAFVRPFAWWNAHPWIVVAALVVLTPFAAVLLRLVDESGRPALVTTLAWMFVALFGAALGVAAVGSARRSFARAALGTLGALAALTLVLWPVTQVRLDRAPCPARGGPDLGAQVAVSALESWRDGESSDAAWRAGQSTPAWLDRSRALSLLDYQLVDTGCWERMAPIDARRTWHEFRVTVQDAEQTTLSKIVVIHTTAGGEGWKITAIEGPLP